MKRFRRLARESSGTLRSWLGGLLASVVLSSMPGYAADAPAPWVKAFPGTLTLHNETLAARVTAVPLGQVMAEFSRLSGARVLWLTPRDEEPVSVDFPALPLSEALERLLGEKNFLLFYTTAGEGMRLTQIWISSREKSEGTPLPEHGAEPAGAPPPPPVRQPLPPRREDLLYSQTAMDAQGPRARSDSITQSRSRTQEDPQMDPIPSQDAHSDSSPQGQEATAATSLLGGTAPSAAGVTEHCLPNASATHFADVTRDGRADAIAVNGRGITVRPSDGRQFLFPQAWTAGSYYGKGGTYLADVTGDGRADAIAVTDDGITLRRASTVGFLPAEAWTTEPYSGSRGTFFVDVTGDGRADAIAVTDNSITVRRSDGSRFLDKEAWTTEPYFGSRGTFFADVTGDGRADAIAVTDDGITLRRASTAGFLPAEAWTTESYSGSRGTYFADVTGDGRADAIAVTDDGITLRPSDGLHFLSPQAWTADPYYGKVGTSFADVTGDGLADAIAVNADKITVRPSTGAGFFSPQSWTIDPYYGDLYPICMG